MNIGAMQWETLRAALGWTGSEEEYERGLRILAAPTYYPVLCSWCHAEGIRNRTGWSTVEGSSRICERHAQQMRAEVGDQRSDEAEPARAA